MECSSDILVEVLAFLIDLREQKIVMRNPEMSPKRRVSLAIKGGNYSSISASGSFCRGSVGNAISTSSIEAKKLSANSVIFEAS